MGSQPYTPRMPGMSPSAPRGLIATGVRTVLRHPDVAVEALRAAWELRGDARARHAYLEWRAVTAYGDPTAITPPDELADYLRWRRRQRRVRS